MPLLTYSVADFQPFTKILSASVNSRFNDLKTLLNTTKLDSTNVQQYGLTRDRLAKTTANAVLINDASGIATEEAQLATTRGGLGFSPTLNLANAGQAVVVNGAGNALTLGTSIADRFTSVFSTDVATLVAGETLASGDAVCLDLDATPEYRVFKCDATKANRRGFIGIAQAAATTIPSIQTITTNANITGTTTFTVNGRAYSVSFNSTSNQTMTDIATAISTDPDVQSAVVTGGSPFRVITVTGKGSLPITLASFTSSGVSFVIASTQANSGQSVIIRTIGLATNLTGLTPSLTYYVSSVTPGLVTATPTDTVPTLVGQALSTTALWIPPRVQLFTSSSVFFATKGSTGGDTAASVTASAERFNYTSWSADASDGAFASYKSGGGENQYNAIGMLMLVDGWDSSATTLTTVRQFNKTSWGAANSQSKTHRVGLGVGQLVGKFWCAGGDNISPSTAIDGYNGTSWSTSGAVLSAGRFALQAITDGSYLRFVAGYAGGGTQNQNDKFDGNSVSTETAITSNIYSVGGACTGGGIVGSPGSSSTASYKTSGSSWSASITMAQTQNVSTAGGSQMANTNCGFNTNNALLLVNGGNANTGATTSLNTSQTFNGTAWSASTSSTMNKSSGSGGVF